MKAWTAAMLVLVSVGLSGCAANQTPLPPMAPDPTLAELAAADYGQYPQNYDAVVKGWTEDSMKDPASVIFKKISKPRKEYMYAERKPVYGYSVCTLLNAKNSYGGYTGNQVYWLMIRDGAVVRSQNLTDNLARGTAGIISLGHYVNCDDGK